MLVLEEGHYKLKNEMEQCVLADEILEFSRVSNRINILAQGMNYQHAFPKKEQTVSCNLTSKHSLLNFFFFFQINGSTS